MKNLSKKNSSAGHFSPIFRFEAFSASEEFRLYAIDASGAFADESFDFQSDGTMTKAFEGWIRLAEVQSPEDREVLDFHAPAVMVDCQLEVEAGGIIKSLGNFWNPCGFSLFQKARNPRFWRQSLYNLI